VSERIKPKMQMPEFEDFNGNFKKYHGSIQDYYHKTGDEQCCVTFLITAINKAKEIGDKKGYWNTVKKLPDAIRRAVKYREVRGIDDELFTAVDDKEHGIDGELFSTVDDEEHEIESFATADDIINYLDKKFGQNEEDLSL